MHYPLVSVILPTYKRSTSLLKRAVESVLAQTYKNIEIIVVDDNATTKTQQYRRNNIDLLKQYDVKLILNNSNLGGALSRNEGIKVATGDYITFLDDDDLFLENKVLHQITYMLTNNLNCSFTDLSIYNEHDVLVDRRVRDDISSFKREDLMKYHLTKLISGTETFMVTRELLLNIGGFDNAIAGQEFFLMWKILNYDDLKIGYYKSDDIKAYRTQAEAISTGPNKIKGEKNVYKFKKEHFKILNFKERNYVKCRHMAVMAVAYFRNKRYLFSLFYGFGAVLINPLTSIKEAIYLKQRITKKRNNKHN